MQDNQRPDSIRKRHTKRQLKRRKQQLRRRYTFFGVLTLIVLSIILFATPLFSIKSIKVEGNINIEEAQLLSALDALKGDNLFLTSKKDTFKVLSGLSYVESVTIKKSYFPASITVIVTECKPSFYVQCSDSSYAIVDKAAKVLEITGTRPEAAELLGLNVTSTNVGEALSTNDQSKLDTAKSVLDSFDRSSLLDGVTSINFEDISNIIFNYENRIDGKCGSSSNFDRKLSLFYEAVNSENFTENTRGTIDLSKKDSHAYYTP